jgi:ecotin
MKYKTLFIGFLIIVGSTTLYAEPAKKDNIYMFPIPKEGYERHVIEVPKQDNENDHKVEFFIGKVMSVDCNHHRLMGRLEKKNLQGWGYSYLEASNMNGMTASTMMACNQPNTDKFITLAPSPESLRRYNSRSPIVIYVPQGYEVRYRIWHADKTIEQAEQR